MLNTVSQPPSPSGGDTQGYRQSDSGKEHGDSQSLPKTVVASLVGPVRTQAETQHPIASKPEYESHWYTSPDWWIAGLTLGLFIATAGLWLFTYKLWKTTARAVTDSAEGLELANKTFLATHRPRIRVRNINVRQVGNNVVDVDGRIRLPSVGATLSGQFYIANIGDDDATILDAHILFVARARPIPMERPYEGQDGNLSVPSALIPPGGSFPILFSHPLNVQEITTDTFINDRDIPIYAMGWVEYKDTAKRTRRTAFCRRYYERDGSARFIAIDDPDYEHEE